MRFEWDVRKAASNLIKHGVSFSEATQVFYDPNVVEGFDAAHSSAEARFFVIGFSSRRLLYVVYAETQGSTIRIISARRANKADREFYERRIY